MPQNTHSKIFGYLRASTVEQDAERARHALEKFAADHQLTIDDWYVENESGATLHRPELFAMLRNCRQGDIIMVEQIDRLSRLNAEDWKLLRAGIETRGVRLISLDLPTSHIFANTNVDEFTARMFDAVNGMMLDMLAAIARKDYTDRRRRQAEGIAAAKAEGRYPGRARDMEKLEALCALVSGGMSILRATKTVDFTYPYACKLMKRVKAGEWPALLERYPALMQS